MEQREILKSITTRQTRRGHDQIVRKKKIEIEDVIKCNRTCTKNKKSTQLE